MMRRIILVVTTLLASALGSVLLSPAAAWAGSPHFVEATATTDGNTLTVAGKEAGLGNETQVHIVVTATALCINNGGHHPKAVNKGSFSAEGDFPVQNGKAEFSLTLVAVFQPDCTPPMTVAWTDIVLTDTEHGVTKHL
jgi:hypothetical protein